MSSTVSMASDFDKLVKLAVDAIDSDIVTVLLRSDEDGADHLVCYYLKIFDKQQRNY